MGEKAESAWVADLRSIAVRLEELGPEESWTAMIRRILELCEEQKYKEARELAKECYEHLDYSYYGLDSAALTHRELSLETRKRMHEMAELIEKAQSIFTRELNFFPTSGVSPFFIMALYTPKD